MKNIVILISGRGSNMASLIKAVADGSLPVRIAAVLANRPCRPPIWPHQPCKTMLAAFL